MNNLSRLHMTLLAAWLMATPFTVFAEEATQRLTGEYVWTGGDSRGPLEAKFISTGDNAWDVAFDFTFDGEPHTYEGTAEGSLSEGKLEGQVRTESGRRTFTFEGTFQDGRFVGTHAELRRGRERSLGSLTLGRGDAETDS